MNWEAQEKANREEEERRRITWAERVAVVPPMMNGGGRGKEGLQREGINLRVLTPLERMFPTRLG